MTKKILLVDNSEYLFQMVKELQLDIIAYKASLDEALHIRYAADLVIINDHKGALVVNKLRNECAYVPIIYIAENSKNNGLKCEFVKCIYKPTTPDKIKNAVQAALNLSSKLTELDTSIQKLDSEIRTWAKNQSKAV